MKAYLRTLFSALKTLIYGMVLRFYSYPPEANGEHRGAPLLSLKIRQEQLARAARLLHGDDIENALRHLRGGRSPDPVRSANALILDPGFADLEGHHYNANIFCKQLLESYGHVPVVLRRSTHHPSFDNDETGSLPVLPVRLTNNC